jgi:acyl carrier protein
MFNTWRLSELRQCALLGKEVSMETKEKIKDILVKLLKVKPEELKDDIALQDGIGVDSTEMVEVVIALEKAFGTKVSAKEVTKFSTLNDIDRLIQSKVSAQ